METKDINAQIDLTNKVTKVTAVVAAAIATFVCSAAATATDPFFRKNMGERYFTPGRAFVSAVGWWTVLILTFAHFAILYGNTPPTFKLLGTIALPFAYLVMAVIQLRLIRRRQQNGEIWHSRSKGESIFGWENPIRDAVIEVVVFILLCFVSYIPAAFFAFSRLLGYAGDALALAMLYNRYLDIQDARIEADFMETALRDGFPPSRTAGLFRPLPRSFKGERRSNIARVVAGGPFAQPVAASAKTSQTQSTTAGAAA
ncbi:MAG TPA: hypothetical protein VFC07_15895 [Verrucomicrobiae bacterium]|nr:hypothetical protein [Verrucomicrobiae bacterium]